MANTNTAILDVILARALLALRGRTVMPMLVNTTYNEEARNFGDTITIEVPSAVGTRAVTPSHIPPSDATDTTPVTTTLALNNWRQTDPFYLSDKDMKEIDISKNFLPPQMSEAVKALAEYVNAQILAQYTGIYNLVGTPAVTPFNESTPLVDVAAAARKLLNKTDAPRLDRRGVLDFDAEAAAISLPAFSNANKRGDAGTIREGELGRVFGSDWFADGQIPTHTLGMVGTPLVDDAAGIAAGVKLIHMDGFTTKPSVGDIFTFTNARASGSVDTQQYVVTASSVLVGTDSDISIEPGLKIALAAGDDDAAITFVASHVVNLNFHRDAFAFASRPLIDSNPFGMRTVSSLTDPVTGLSLRLEVDAQHKRTAYELDILFGTALIRPELATRIAG